MLVRSTGGERCLRKLKFSLYPQMRIFPVFLSLGAWDTTRTKEAWDGVIWEGQNGHHLSIFHLHRKTFNTLLSGNPGVKKCCSKKLKSRHDILIPSKFLVCPPDRWPSLSPVPRIKTKETGRSKKLSHETRSCWHYREG